MQSGMEPPTTPGSSDAPPPMSRGLRLHLPVQSAQIRGWLARPIGKLVLAALLVVIIGGGVGGFFLVRSLIRHGLPDDIPLPDHSSFVSHQQSSSNDPNYGTLTVQEWFVTVSDTTTEQAAIFYQSQLPSNGWQHVFGSVVSCCILIFGDKGKEDSPSQEDLTIAVQQQDTNILLDINLIQGFGPPKPLWSNGTENHIHPAQTLAFLYIRTFHFPVKSVETIEAVETSRMFSLLSRFTAPAPPLLTDAPDKTQAR